MSYARGGKVIFLAPFVITGRVVSKVWSDISAPFRRTDHIVSYNEEELGLAELVQHRCIMLRTLYERREPLPLDEGVIVHARFLYPEPTFIGGDNRIIRSGSIIEAEFILGGNQGEFVLNNAVKDRLPKNLLLYWKKEKEPGSIIPK